MRIFVAGATGAVGSRLIPLLISAGHSVLGTTRTPDKAEAIRRARADVAVLDALDGAAVREAVISAKPDVIVHEMTALSGVSDLRRFDSVFALTNRLRTEGLDHLLAAAKQAGTPRVIAQSFGGWPFART
jgi:2-alkyl-3-oxoalkanoate reductase